jgi:ferredoxin
MLSLILNTNKRQAEQDTTPCWERVHFPLTSAYLCQDCNSVGNCAMQCPACASTVLLNLSAVLNREVEAVVNEMDYEFIPASVRMRTLEEEAAA